MKVLFVQPGLMEINNQYPPVGILYLASVARERGYDVDVYDAASEGCSLDTALGFAIDFQPDVLCLSLYTIGLPEQFRFLNKIETSLSGCTIVAGGPHATALPVYTMQECTAIDFLVFGEGERTIIELFEAIKENKAVDGISGICYRKDVEIVQNDARELIDDLDEITFPAFDLLRKNGFHYERRSFNLSDNVGAIISSRGCPFNCSFCFKATFGSRLRRRTPRNVVAEMKWQMEEFMVEEFQFLDDLFAVNAGWLNEFYEELERQEVRVPWKCLARVTSVTNDDLIKMQRNGCYGVEFGVESGNDEVLRDAGKGITTEQVRIAFKTAKAVGLMTSGFFIFGLRKDNHETINQTLALAKEISPDACGFATLLPFPGAKVHAYLPEDLRYKWERFNSYYDKKALPFSLCSVSSEDLLRYRIQAEDEVSGSMSYLFANVILRKGKFSSHRKEAFYKWHSSLRTLIKRGICGDRVFVRSSVKNAAYLIRDLLILAVETLFVVLPYRVYKFGRNVIGGMKV